LQREARAESSGADAGDFRALRGYANASAARVAMRLFPDARKKN